MSDRESVFQLPISLYYRPPVSLFYLLTFVHGAGVISIFQCAVPTLTAALISILVFLSYCLYVYKYYRARKSPVYLILQPEDKWLLIDSSKMTNPVFRVYLEPGSFVHPLLIVLIAKYKNRRYPFILTSGNTDNDMLRRLRVRLRFPSDSIQI